MILSVFSFPLATFTIRPAQAGLMDSTVGLHYLYPSSGPRIFTPHLYLQESAVFSIEVITLGIGIEVTCIGQGTSGATRLRRGPRFPGFTALTAVAAGCRKACN